MRRFNITLSFAMVVVLIWAPSSNAQTVTPAQRQQFSTTTTGNSTSTQGVSLRSQPIFSQTIQCWRCGSPCENGYCCYDSNPQCCVFEGRCACCRSQFVLCLAFGIATVLIWTPSSNAQSVTAEQREEYAQVTTENPSGDQGISFRTDPLLNRNSNCWRCSAPVRIYIHN
ncbi:unnamed protein product [Orchesella dallaii]|uniref:Uncharacterized protein n=1 Tax=Orchesella dallaii TaxID=48710 RepID=A0ABP1PKJ4_9HEXA